MVTAVNESLACLHSLQRPCLPATSTHGSLRLDTPGGSLGPIHLNSDAGCQRLQLALSALQNGSDLSSAQQIIRADAAPTYIPPEARQGVAYWPSHVWNRYDAFGLAQEATNLFNAMAPKVSKNTPGLTVPCRSCDQRLSGYIFGQHG